MVDLEPPDGPADLALLSGLSTARVLDCGTAAGLVGISRTTVAAWCREDPPLPHDARPGRRPAQQLSEREVAARALREPTTRRKALAALDARMSRTRAEMSDGGPAWAGAPSTNPPAAAPGKQAVTHPLAPGSAGGAAEVDRLRGEVIRLQEQLAHLTGVIEELQASDARKTALWLAALRASGSPTNAAALDGLPPGQPGRAATPTHLR